MRLQAVTPGNNNLLSQCCTSTFLCECTIRKKHWWFDWFSTIAIAASFRQNFRLQKWVFVCQEQKNNLLVADHQQRICILNSEDANHLGEPNISQA